MIVCAECQFKNRPTARFCKNCGAALEQPDTPQSEVPVGKPVEKLVETDQISEESEKKEPLQEEYSPVELIPDEIAKPDDEEREMDETENQDGTPENIIKPDENVRQEEPLEKEETAVEQIPGREIDDSLVVEPIVNGEPKTVQALDNPPLEPGARLAGRYEIVGLLEETRETLLYDALDYGRCPQCNYGDSLPGDTYCANCGASLTGPDGPPHIHLRSLRMAGEAVIRLEEETDGKIESWFEDNGRLYAILPIQKQEEIKTDASVSFGQGVHHLVGYSSHEGLQRKLNEDAMLAVTLAPTLQSQSGPSLGLYAVADGMGGHASGEVASKLAVEGLAEIIVKRLLLPELVGETVLSETPAVMLADAIHSINNQIFQLQESTGSDMGTTITCALVRNTTATIANVGDSRTYLWREGQLSQLTVDHSLVAELVAAGAIEPEDIYTHPEKSAIYRSLGHSFSVEVDIFTKSIEPGDKLLLCSDGAWEMLRQEGIEEVLLLEQDPQRACDEIIRRSNLAGGEDNISAIIVQFDRLGN